MGRTNQPEDLLTRIKDLERRVSELQRGQTQHGSVLSQGSFEVKTPDGHTIMKCGQFVYYDEVVYGMAVFRHDGTTQFWSYDSPSGGGFTSFWDEAQNILFSSDTVSGQGLARPYIPLRVMPYSEVLGAAPVTVSATFERLHRIHGEKQHPKIKLQIITRSAADTTGEVQLAIGGVNISDVITVPLGDNTYRGMIGVVPGGFLSELFIDVEARRTAGTGNVSVAVAYADGRQS